MDKNTVLHPDHPLFAVFIDAITQAMYGKGQRHGGCVTPFLEQPWRHYAKLHGRGFLTGQAAKKLEEAASIKNGEDFIQELRGAIVYCGMAILYEQDAMRKDVVADLTDLAFDVSVKDRLDTQWSPEDIELIRSLSQQGMLAHEKFMFNKITTAGITKRPDVKQAQEDLNKWTSDVLGSINEIEIRPVECVDKFDKHPIRDNVDEAIADALVTGRGFWTINLGRPFNRVEQETLDEILDGLEEITVPVRKVRRVATHNWKYCGVDSIKAAHSFICFDCGVKDWAAKEDDIRSLRNDPCDPCEAKSVIAISNEPTAYECFDDFNKAFNKSVEAWLSLAEDVYGKQYARTLTLHNKKPSRIKTFFKTLGGLLP